MNDSNLGIGHVLEIVLGKLRGFGFTDSNLSRPNSKNHTEEEHRDTLSLTGPLWIDQCHHKPQYRLIRPNV